MSWCSEASTACDDTRTAQPVAGIAAELPEVSASEATEIIQGAIAGHRLVVFSKTYCPSCYKVKQILNSLGVEPTVLELDKMGSTGLRLQGALKQVTGTLFVPKIWMVGSWLDSAAFISSYCEGSLVGQLAAANIPIVT